MENKRRQIKIWLDEMCKGQSFEFEENDTSISILYHLMEKNKKADADMKTAMEEWQQSINFYTKEANAIDRILGDLGISAEQLPDEMISNIKTVASVSAVLNVEEPDEPSITLALMDLSTKKADLESELESRRAEATKLSEELEDQLSTNSALENLLKSLDRLNAEEEADVKKKVKKATLLQDKARGYGDGMKQYKKELSDAGYDPTFSHSALVKLSQELQSEKEQLATMKKKLATYNSLTPDISLAKVELEEARRELAGLEKKMDMDCLSVLLNR